MRTHTTTNDDAARRAASALALVSRQHEDYLWQRLAECPQGAFLVLRDGAAWNGEPGRVICHAGPTLSKARKVYVAQDLGRKPALSFVNQAGKVWLLDFYGWDNARRAGQWEAIQAAMVAAEIPTTTLERKRFAAGLRCITGGMECLGHPWLNAVDAPEPDAVKASFRTPERTDADEDELAAWREVCRQLKECGAVTDDDLRGSHTETTTKGRRLFRAIRAWGAARNFQGITSVAKGANRDS